MEFRPCIDIHNGKVKQIVGGSLNDNKDAAKENFVSDKDAGYYARLYKELGLKGGHVILLNSKDSEYYEKTKAEAILALREYPNALQIGGGINIDNAKEFLDAGASHVIVTSYVFNNGRLNEDRLKALSNLVGKDHLVLDLSCNLVDGKYILVTDRWQKNTDIELDYQMFKNLSQYCDEFLVHAVNVEGTGLGIDTSVLQILADSQQCVTYAGGISSYDDIDTIKEYGKGRVNFTIGSCLDIFGGQLKISEVIRCTQ